MSDLEVSEVFHLRGNKAALEAIRDKCTEVMEIDMGEYESVPVGFTRSIYEMAHAALSGMEVSDD